MPEHITDERAEQIAALADEIRRAPSRFTKDFVVENLADGVADLSGVIDRLREQLAAANERAETAEQERDLAIAHDRQPYPTAWAYEQACAALETQRKRAETAEAENAQLRARLDGLGEVREEWGLHPRGFELDRTRPIGFGEDGRARAAINQQQWHAIASRPVGDWRVVGPEDALAADATPAACRSCGTTERVLGDPPLCSNCANYGGLPLGPLGLAPDAAADGHSAPVSPGNDANEHRDASQPTEPPQTPRGADT